MTASFLVSVVVPARDAATTIGRCLDALAAQTCPADRRELIVVDDGSVDATRELARASGACVLAQPTRGPAAARNLGARRARGDLLLFTDADCAPEPTWIERMVAPFADPSVVATKGAYRTEQTALAARFAQAEYEDKYRRMARFPTIDFVDTYAAAYRRDRFLDAGGFDERYPTAANEDLDLSFRLAERGARMLFVPEARVHHQHPTGLVAYARRKYRVGRWKPLLHADHPAKARADTHTPATLRPQVGLAALAALCLLGAPVSSLARRAAAALLAVHLATSLPFAVRLGRRDPALGLAVPLFVLVRSLALAAGYAVGLLALGRHHLPVRGQPP